MQNLEWAVPRRTSDIGTSREDTEKTIRREMNDMGFFSRIFGGGTGSDSVGSSSAPAAEKTDMPPILRTSRKGGYDKRETLVMLDKLTAEKILLEEALAAKNSGAPYQIPPEADRTKPNTVKMGGFDEEDVDTYAERLAVENDSLRSRLV